MRARRGRRKRRRPRKRRPGKPPQRKPHRSRKQQRKKRQLKKQPPKKPLPLRSKSPPGPTRRDTRVSRFFFASYKSAATVGLPLRGLLQAQRRRLAWLVDQV